MCSMSALERTSENMSLPALQSKMKCDPEGYEMELVLVYNQFKAALELFKQQTDFGSHSDIRRGGIVAKDLADRALFLAHVTPFYPIQLAQFPSQLSQFLHSSARTLPSGLRWNVVQSLILLMNRKIVDIDADNLALFMELQIYGDKASRTVAYNHVIHSIRRMNMKHKNEVKNRALQNVLFQMLQQEDENKAKRALITLCELHRRKVWFDENTGNAICCACLHHSPRIMIASLSFLLHYKKMEEDDSDASSDEETLKSHVAVNGKDTYKAHHKGTHASKKKKKAKLQRAIRNLKKHQRLASEKNISNHTPLNHLKDPQRMMLMIIARVIRLHRLVVEEFYSYCVDHIMPGHSGVTEVLAAAVQACHDMVPPDFVQPLLKHIVNKFVNDRAPPEAIAVGLNTTREICLRMPLIMNEGLLQDLALYKKTHTKAVSVAARSLIGLFRELNPSLLIKKDRGRQHAGSKAHPKPYGHVDVASDVPGLDLLNRTDNFRGEYNDEPFSDDIVASSDDEGLQITDHESGSEDDSMISEDEYGDEIEDSDNDEVEEEDEDENTDNDEEEEFDDNDYANDDNSGVKENIGKKRKFRGFDSQLYDAETSLRTLKRLANENMVPASSDSADGFLSNEDFQKIKHLKANELLAQQGLFKKGSAVKSTALKIFNPDELSMKPLDPAKLEVHIKRRMTKEEKLALMKAGRKDRGEYMARAAIKRKKTGGLSNKQKERKKAMPVVAKRAKVAKSQVVKRKKQQLSRKNFRGKKAWK